MSRTASQRGLNLALIGMLLGTLAGGAAFAQDSQPTSERRPPAPQSRPRVPTTQPTTRPGSTTTPTDDFRRLQEAARRAQQRDLQNRRAERDEEDARPQTRPAAEQRADEQPTTQAGGGLEDAARSEEERRAAEAAARQKRIEEIRRLAEERSRRIEEGRRAREAAQNAGNDNGGQVEDEEARPVLPQGESGAGREGIERRPPVSNPRVLRRPGQEQPEDQEPPQDEAGPPADEGADEEVAAGEDEATTQPEEGEWFNFVGMPWMDVIHAFARRLGKPLMDEESILLTGDFTYETDRTFTKEEAIDELNFLLHQQGYHFVEQRDRIYVVMTADMPTYVDPSHVYGTRAEYQAAQLRPMDYAIVYVRVEGRPAQEVVDLFGGNIPVDTLVSAIEKSNQVKISGVARDIDRFLLLMDKIETENYDPQDTRFIPVKTNVGDIERIVREVYDLGGGGPQRQYNPQTRRIEIVQPESGGDVTLTADERTNNLILKGPKPRLDEIAGFIEKIDKQPDIGEFTTKVIEIQHGDAREVASLLNDIFQQEQGSQPSWQIGRQIQQRNIRNRNVRNQPQNQGATPAELLGEGIFERAKKTIRVVAYEATNSIAVYANKDGHERVSDMLAKIDKPQPSNVRVFEIEHADVNDVYQTVSQLVQGARTGGSRFGSQTRSAIVVPDTTHSKLYVMAEPDEMERIAEVIGKLDVAVEDTRTRHVIQLRQLTPSTVAETIRGMLEDQGGSAPQPFRRGRFQSRMRSSTPSAAGAAQIIPLDEAQVLIVICDDEDWAKIEDTIRLWDENFVSNTPQMKSFEIEQGDASAIANTLSGLYRFYEHPTLGRSTVAIASDGSTIYVQAVQPAIEEIGALIATMDVADANQLVILPLANADATQVSQYLQMTYMGGSARFGRRGGGGGTEVLIQPEPVTNSLIVRADASTLEKIKDFAQEMDEKVGAQTPETRFYTLRYSQPRDVASAIQQMFAAGGGSRFRGQATGTQVKAVVAGDQVVVEAPKEKMAEVDAFITQLDDPKGKEIVIRTMKMAGADVSQIASKLNAAFALRGREQAITARFDADPSSETILLTYNRDLGDEIDALLKEYEEAYKPITPKIEFRALQYAQAADVVPQLRDQLITAISKQYGRSAAQQLSVSADTRTNRVIINGPQVAVELAMGWLEQYDVPAPDAPVSPVDTKTYKLPGLDVGTLARNLSQIFANKPSRPDRLRAVFAADQTTETILVSAPKDEFPEIDQRIEEYQKETEDLTPEQKFVKIENASAQYVATLLQNLLNIQISRTRGSDVARRVNISVDERGNKLVINAPKFVFPMAESLIAQLDQVSTVEGRIHTVQLANADVNTVAGILNDVLRERLRQKRDFRISAEPTMNALIVSGDKEDFEEIEKWAKELDEQFVSSKGEPKIFDLKNANPWEVLNVLNAQFAPKRGQRNKLGQEISFSVVGGRSLVVQAPPDKLEEIGALVERLDNIGPLQLQVRTYELPGIGNAIGDLARQVMTAVNNNVGAREERVSITPYPQADTMIVTAREDQFPQIEAMMERFKGLFETEKTVTKFVKLEHLNAGAVAGQIQNMLASKLNREGRSTRNIQNLQISADPRTNRLICYLPEKIVPDLDELLAQLDVPPEIDQGQIRTIPLAYADAGQVANILQSFFGQRVARRAAQDASVIEVRIQAEPITNSLLVQASDEDFDKIKEKAVEIDEGAIVRKSDPELIKLEYADPWQLVNVLNAAFTESGQGWGTRRNVQKEVNVQVVGANLLVQAPREKLEEVRDLIAKLDVVDTGEIVVKTFVLPGMSWELNNLAGTIQRTLDAIAPRSRSQQRASITAYPQTDTLIAAVPKNQMPRVEELLEQFTQSTGERTPVTKFYDLAYARANEIVGTLNQILQPRIKQTRGSRAQQELSVVADARANRIAVTGPETIQAEVEKVLTSIDVPADEEMGDLRAFPLTESDAGTVASTLRPLFQEKASRKRADKSYVPVTLTPETITNTLLVYGGDDQDVQVIEEQLERMEEESRKTDLAPVVIDLKYADPNQVRSMINEMYGSGSRRGGSTPQDVKVSITGTGIALQGPPKKVEEIKALVGKIDTEGQGLDIKVYTLKVLDAQQTAMGVQLALRSMGQRPKPGQMQPGAFAEPTTNTLIVMADKAQMPFIDTLITKLEMTERPISEPRPYELKFVRAEMISDSVDAMLKAKVAEQEGQRKQQMVYTAVEAVPGSNRLIVFAPDEYHELARQIIALMDAEVDTGEIVHIITLEQGDAVAIADTISQTIRSGAGSSFSRGARGRRGGAPGGDTSARQVTVTPDEGSNSIVVAGLEKDVAFVEDLIRELEVKSETIPELQVFQLDNSSTTDVVDALTQIFPASRDPMNTVTITADDYMNRLIVTANKRKMRQVQTFIKELDKAPDTSEYTFGLAGGKQIYFVDVNRGDPTTIAWDVADLFPEGPAAPEIESDWFGEYIIVKCRPSQFPQVERLIREYEGRHRVETVIHYRKLKTTDIDAVMSYVKGRMDEDVQIMEVSGKPEPKSLVVPLWEEGEEPDAVRKKKEAEKRNTGARVGRASKDIAPMFLDIPAALALLDRMETFDAEESAHARGPQQQESRGDDEDAAANASTPRPRPAAEPASLAVAAAQEEPTTQPAPPLPQRYASPYPKEKVQIAIQPDGSLILKGPEGEVEDVEDFIDILEEDLAAGEVIRIFEFKYGDVTAAARILDQMFNDQQVLRIARPQQQQQQQQGRGGRQGQEGEGEQQNRPQNMMEQFRQMVGGRAEGGQGSASQRIRIATDPGHNYLIVKCDESQLPDIKQLLRELDIPPGEVSVEVFQLHNTEAGEMAQNLKEVLGIAEAERNRQNPFAGIRGAGRGQQNELLQILQQEMVTIGGGEGPAKIESVQIVPNQVTNSLMVSAPPEVMDIIRNAIEQLEGLEGLDNIVINYYPLDDAKVSDIVPLLQEIFAATGGGGGGGGRGQRGGGSASPGALGPVTINGDPRTNTIIFTCEAKDVETVRSQIQKLDLEGSVNGTDIYVCEYGDASQIAQAVEAIMISSGGAGRQRGGGGGGGMQDDLRIVAETGTNAVIVWGPEDKRTEVLDKVIQLDENYKQDIREIPLANADPEDLAEKLNAMFAGQGGAVVPGGRGRRGGGGTQVPSGRVVILGDTDSKKLLVRAPEHVYKQILDVVQVLDVPAQDLQVRSFALEYADATAAVEEMKTAMTEFMTLQRATGQDSNFDAFTAVPVTRTNSIIVVGSPETFAFVQSLLAVYDTETPASQQKVLRLFVLDKADAATVAETINALSRSGSAAAGGSGGRGGRGNRGRAGAMMGGGSTGGGGEYNVTASAEESTNSVIVYGTADDVEKIEQFVIAKFQEMEGEGQPTFVKLDYARAASVAQTLTEFFQNRERGSRGAGGSRPADQVSFSADPDTNTLIYVATGQNRAFVEDLIQQLDQEEGGREIQLFQLQFASASSAAEVITRTFEESNRRGATDADRVVATPDVPSNTVVVRANSASMKRVTGLLEEMEDTIRVSYDPVTIPIVNAPASQVASMIWQFLGDTSSQDSGRGGQRGGGGEQRRGPQIVPNDNAQTLVVRGTPAEVSRIRQLAEKFDDPSLITNAIKVVPIPLGQDVVALAAMVQDIVNEGEAINAEREGRPPREIAVRADEFSHTLIASGDPATFGIIDDLVSQLAQVNPPGQVTTVIQFTNLSAEDAVQMINDISSRRSSGSSRGTSGARPSTPTRRSSGTNSGVRRRTGGRQGSWLWDNTPAELRDGRTPGGMLQPFISVLPVTAMLGGQVLEQVVGDEARVSGILAEMHGSQAGPATQIPNGRGAIAIPGGRELEAATLLRSQIYADERPGRLEREVVLPAPRTHADAIPASYRLAMLQERSELPTTRPRNRADRPARPRRDETPAALNRNGRDAAPEKQEAQEKEGQEARGRAARNPRAQDRAQQERTPPNGDRQDRPRAGEQPRPMPDGVQISGPTSAPATDEPRVERLANVEGELLGEVSASVLDSRRIIVTGNQRDVAFIEDLLRRMELDAPQSTIEVFTLDNAKATALAPILTEAMQNYVEQRSGGTARPSDRFSINAEARSNSLIVAASEPNMQIIEDLIVKLAGQTDQIPWQFETIPLNNTRATEAVAQLKPTIDRISELRGLEQDERPSIQALDRENAVLIVGTPSDIEEITRLVKAVDIELTPDVNKFGMVSEMVIVTLENGLAEDVAQVLTDMIDAEQEAAREAAGAERPGKPVARVLRLTGPDGKQLPDLNLEKPIRIVPEKGTNSLIIFSTAENNEALTEIVSVFDTLPKGEAVELRAFVLNHANAEQVAETMQNLFDDSKKALKRPAEGDSDTFEKGVMPPKPQGLAAQGLPYQVVVTFDARSNSVFVVGRSDAVLLAAGLVQQMDRPSMELTNKPFVLQLKNLPAATLAERLTDLLDKRAEALGENASPRDNAIVVPDERSNSLVVLATQEVFDMVQDLALQLDDAENYSPVDTRFRQLEYADAQKLQGLLQEVFDRREEAEGEQTEESKNTLSVTSDVRSNALVLTGTRDYLEEAEELIAKLDQGFDPTVEVKIKQIRLNSAPNIATLLQDMIDKSLATQDSKLQGTPIYVAADPLSDSVVMAASHEDMILLERWVELLDRPTEIGRTVKIIPVTHPAEDFAQSANDLFSGRGGDDSGKLTITADPTTNAVVAIGPPAVVEEVAQFVRNLDSTVPTYGAVVRLFKLEQADAESTGELLESLLSGQRPGGGGQSQAQSQVLLYFQQQHPELGLETLKAIRADIGVQVNERTNSLLITAPPESMPLMESLVRALDIPPDTANVRTFALRNADAEEMVTTLESVFEQRTTSTGGGGTGGTQDQIERQLALEGGRASEGGRQQISFSADLRTNSVIAAGTQSYLDIAESLILDLDTIPIKDRKVSVYTPRNITAESLQQSFSEFTEAQQQRLQDMGEEISAQRKQEREILSVYNEDSNVVIFDYDPRFEQDVFDIVQQLDQPPPQVMIQVLIVEVTVDNSLELGVEFAFQDLQFAKAGPNDTTTFDYVGGTDIGAAGSGLGGFSFTITGADFNFLLRTLQNEGSLQVLSRPQVVAMDNQEATIQITNSVPYVTGTAAVAGQLTTQVSREDVGIVLTVTPQINPDGFIRMKVRQEVSDITSSTVDIGQGVTAPIFFERVADTTVTVKDNETVVLGGLITSRDERREQKVPLIGDIPGLGLLFRNNVDDSSRTELLIVMTPRIIRSMEDYRDLSIEERNKTGILPNKLLTSPLMQGLRVEPDALDDVDHEDLLGPFEPETIEQPRTQPSNRNGQKYGPPPRKQPAAGEADRPKKNSYDVPVSAVTRRRGGS